MSKKITGQHFLCWDSSCKHSGLCALSLEIGKKLNKFPHLDLRNKRKDYSETYYEDMTPAPNEYNLYCRDYQEKKRLTKQ